MHYHKFFLGPGEFGVHTFLLYFDLTYTAILQIQNWSKLKTSSLKNKPFAKCVWTNQFR